MLELLRSVSVKNITSLYNDNKTCADIVNCIATSIMDETLDKVRQSPWFGVIVDESTDISIHHHMIIYLSYLEDESVPCSTFYGMVRTNDSTSKGIFDKIMHELENANLDMKKLIAFGSEGRSTMVGRKKGVATLMKRVNPMLTSIHCVAHRTNLVVSDTTKKITYAKHFDGLINSIVNYFSSSSNRMEELKIVQEELDCEVIKMQCIFEVRWLSRHGCLAKIFKSMDALLCLLAKERMDLHAIRSTFECIYAMHFLVDILQKLTYLSLRFQRDYVDVSTIHGTVISPILCIKDEYLIERKLDLNACQKGIGEYPIIPNYGADNGFLYALRCSLKGDMFFGQKVVRDVEGKDLANVLEFQFTYAKKFTIALRSALLITLHFVDNTVLNCVKNLVPTLNPSHERLFKKLWGEGM